MGFNKFDYTKDWTDPADFPTFVDNELQVRADMQFLFDEIKVAHNALVEEVKQQIAAEEAVILTVGAEGCRFTTINAAIDHAKTYCSPSNRVIIQIGPGVYDEKIELLPNPGIDFVGSGCENTIVRKNAAWPDAPIHVTGSATYSNIGFEAHGTSYALHMDVQDTPTVTGRMVFERCKFVAYGGGAGVGVGMGQDTELIFQNCDIQSAQASAIYAHNLPTEASNQVLKFYDCRLVSFASGGIAVVIDNSRRRAGNIGTSNMVVSFAGTCARIPSFDYRYNNTDTLHALKKATEGGDEILLLDDSINCNIKGLNFETCKITLSGYFTVQSNEAITIPLKDANLYAWMVDNAYTVAGADIKSSVTLNAPHVAYVYASCNNATVLNDKAINITLTGVPIN